MAYEETSPGLTNPDDLMELVLSGQATDEERAALEALLKPQVQGKPWPNLFVRSLAKTDSSFNFNAERFMDTIQNRIAENESHQSSRAITVPSHRRRRTYAFALFASVCVIAVIFGSKLFRAYTGTGSIAVASQLYETGPGMFATVTLRDGERVVLAPQTRLIVTTESDRTRRATLIGEAHFDVTPIANAPFVVQTGKVQTRVLGTRFEVRRYANDSAGQVIVHSGRVSTQGEGAAITLAAGMAATFTDSLVASVDFPPSVHTDWDRRELVFRSVPVPVMLATLERSYGMRFLLTDSSLVSRHVVAAFPIGKPTEMLFYLRQLLDVSTTLDGSRVVLCGKTQVVCTIFDQVTRHDSVRSLPIR